MLHGRIKRVCIMALLGSCFVVLAGRVAQAQRVEIEVIRNGEFFQAWVRNTETRSVRIDASLATDCVHVFPCGSGSTGQILRAGERIQADTYHINCGMGEGNDSTNCPASVKYQVQVKYYRQ